MEKILSLTFFTVKALFAAYKVELISTFTTPGISLLTPFQTKISVLFMQAT
jgi:hypothetical protein